MKVRRLSPRSVPLDGAAVSSMPGPLQGIRVVEFAGIGPGPYCGMILADLGAEVIRIERPGGEGSLDDIHSRGRRSVILDLKHPDAVEAALRICDRAKLSLRVFGRESWSGSDSARRSSTHVTRPLCLAV